MRHGIASGRSLRSPACLMLALSLLGCAGSQSSSQSQVIRSFTANPPVIEAGQSSMLSWDIANAREVSLGGAPAAPGWSSARVSPIRTTTYKLTAVTASGETATSEATVTVNQGPILAKVAVDPAAGGRPLPAGFLGLSHDQTQAQLLMGDPSIGANPLYRQLLSNLMRDSQGPFSIRIRGSQESRASVPDRSLTTALASLHQDLSATGRGVSFILGLNMAQGVPGLARMQAQAYRQTLPSSAIDAFELGNRPDLFVQKGHREPDYNFAEYLAEYQIYAAQLGELEGQALALTAPSTEPGSDGSSDVLVDAESLEQLLMSQYGAIASVSQHAAKRPAADCTAQHMLEPATSAGLTESLKPFLETARRAAKPYRVIELDSDVCGAAGAGGGSFASALWLADSLFEQAYAGVSAVNIHGNLWAPDGGWDPQALFRFGVPAQQYKVSAAKASPPGTDAFTERYTLRSVSPMYYGMLFFAEATANQAELLPVASASDDNIKVWATRDRQSGRIALALINKDTQAFGRVQVEVAGYRSGEIKRLVSPSVESTRQITYGGQTFDDSQDGLPVGVEQRERVEPVDGIFEVAVGPGSAVLLQLQR